MKKNTPPPSGRLFYIIHANEDGTVDVYLKPQEDTIMVVKNITPSEGLEENIRRHYEMWCDSAETISSDYTQTAGPGGESAEDRR